MAVFRCKICGGELLVTGGEPIAVCTHCKTRQTLPKSYDEEITNLFNRANHLRLKCEFDRAEKAYERILELDDTEAEAHWGIVLCRYGIEYVSDTDGARIPTCHRTLYESVTSDADYIAAVKHALPECKALYEKEAKRIEELQRDILEIVDREDPFDVFICYKEKDSDGRRTSDSAIANEIYHQLTAEGFKVFYSAITLEDKLGREYEPYIFAALTSARVMLCIGTKPEYFESVWMRNEWSRFLKQTKRDRTKLLIPCYRDMDAYDLPEEFAHLQAQDMTKIGFINDVVRGIRKVTGADNAQTQQRGERIAALQERAILAVEDGEWKRAEEFCEEILDLDARNARAYYIKLMIDCKARSVEGLYKINTDITKNRNYGKALRFADEVLRAELSACVEAQKQVAKEHKRKMKLRNKRIFKIIALAVTGIIIAAAVILTVYKLAIPAYHYDRAGKLASEGDVLGAVGEYQKADGYKDSLAQIIKVYDNATTLGIGWYHMAAVLENGKVITGGKNDLGQCNTEKWSDIVSVAVYGDHTLGLRSDGTVVATGDDRYSQCSIHSWSNITAIATGLRHSAGVTADGRVVTAGQDIDKSCDTDKWRNMVDVAVGWEHTVGLRIDGTVAAAGNNTNGECDVDTWTDIVDIACGENYTLGVRSDGTVVYTGLVKFENSTNSWDDVVKVFCGDFEAFGITSDGRVLCTDRTQKQSHAAAEWTDIAAIVGSRQYNIGLKTDGTLVGDIVTYPDLVSTVFELEDIKGVKVPGGRE